MKTTCQLAAVFALWSFAIFAAQARGEESFTREQDVIYGRKFGMALTMDVFTPKQNAHGGAIVVCISGGWSSNHDNIQPVVASIPLKRGYTVFAVVHGSQPKFTIPECVDDMRRAIDTVAASVRESLANSRPVTSFGVGEAEVERVACNRRVVVGGRATFKRYSRTRDPAIKDAPEGRIDPRLTLLSFWDGERAVAALSFYAVHPMSHYGGGGVSADFPGRARASRERALPGVALVHFTGAAGDVTAARYNAGDDASQDLVDIVERPCPRRVGMLPAQTVRDVEGFVDGIGTGQQRRVIVEMTEDPVLLEPADVAHLPDGRLQEVRLDAQHLGIRELLEQRELDVARVQQRVEEGIGGRAWAGIAHAVEPPARVYPERHSLACPGAR